MSKPDAETAVPYAALILADADVAITADKLQILLAVAGIEDIEPIWTTLFAKALENKNVKEILTTVPTSGPAQEPEVEQAPADEQDGSDEDEHRQDDSDGDFTGSLFD